MASLVAARRSAPTPFYHFAPAGHRERKTGRDGFAYCGSRKESRPAFRLLSVSRPPFRLPPFRPFRLAPFRLADVALNAARMLLAVAGQKFLPAPASCRRWPFPALRRPASAVLRIASLSAPSGGAIRSPGRSSLPPRTGTCTPSPSDSVGSSVTTRARCPSDIHTLEPSEISTSRAGSRSSPQPGLIWALRGAQAAAGSWLQSSPRRSWSRLPASGAGSRRTTIAILFVDAHL